MLGSLFLSLPLLFTAIQAVPFQKLGKRSVTGPVMTQNFPDPSVIQVADGTYYAYATAGNGKNAQVASSPDFNTWTWIDTDPLPFTTLPSWIQSGSTGVWAPDVVLLVCILKKILPYTHKN